MLKRALFVFSLMLNLTPAKWDGLYLRGNASTLVIHGVGSINVNLAAGYGIILPGYFSQGLYLGIDGELLNVSIGVGTRGTWSINPKLLFRLGAPKIQYLPYIAPSLAAYKDGEKYLFTGGLRAGVDFDFISPSFFWGIHIDGSYTLNAPGENFSIWTSGFTFGYRF